MNTMAFIHTVVLELCFSTEDSALITAYQCAYYAFYIICDSSNVQYYLGQMVCTLGRRASLLSVCDHTHLRSSDSLTLNAAGLLEILLVASHDRFSLETSFARFAQTRKTGGLV